VGAWPRLEPAGITDPGYNALKKAEHRQSQTVVEPIPFYPLHAAAMFMLALPPHAPGYTHEQARRRCTEFGGRSASERHPGELLDSQNNAGTTTATMGVLVGDSNGDGTVNSGDAQQTRNRSGQTADGTIFRSDVNTDGTVNSGDAFIVRDRSGTGLPAN